MQVQPKVKWGFSCLNLTNQGYSHFIMKVPLCVSSYCVCWVAKEEYKHKDTQRSYFILNTHISCDWILECLFIQTKDCGFWPPISLCLKHGNNWLQTRRLHTGDVHLTNSQTSQKYSPLKGGEYLFKHVVYILYLYLYVSMFNLDQFVEVYFSLLNLPWFDKTEKIWLHLKFL